MRSVVGRVAAAAGLLGAVVGSAPATAANILDEWKVGFLNHDAGIFGSAKEPGWDVNGELRFASPGFLAPIFAPRPHLGISINTEGATNIYYFGLTWEFNLFRNIAFADDRLTLGFSLGGAAHDGANDTQRLDRKALGSRLLFRESVEIGYGWNASQSISFMIDHVSNANLARRNEGLDTFGIRYGQKF